jgi:hypothetical protein
MIENMIRHNKNGMVMGWGHDIHENDLFVMKKTTELTCKARMKRLNEGFCHWFTMSVVRDNLHASVETKLWVCRENGTVFVWDTWGRVGDSSNGSGFGFNGLYSKGGGMEAVIRIMRSLLKIMLLYRLGDIDKYSIVPISASSVKVMKCEWEAWGRSDVKEPGAFGLQDRDFNIMANGATNARIVLEDLEKRACWPKQIMIHDGSVVDFSTGEVVIPIV